MNSDSNLEDHEGDNDGDMFLEMASELPQIQKITQRVLQSAGSLREAMNGLKPDFFDNTVAAIFKIDPQDLRELIEKILGSLATDIPPTLEKILNVVNSLHKNGKMNPLLFSSGCVALRMAHSIVQSFPYEQIAFLDEKLRNFIVVWNIAKELAFFSDEYKKIAIDCVFWDEELLDEDIEDDDIAEE